MNDLEAAGESSEIMNAMFGIQNQIEKIKFFGNGTRTYSYT